MPPATQSVVDLTITFSPPMRENGASDTVHERSLRAVPRSQAEQMRADFKRYQSNEESAQKDKLYRFSQDGSEVLLPIDFGEVIAITRER
jgi:hypothetical protein